MTTSQFAILDDLVRLVMRAFYSEEQSLYVDVLLKHHKPLTEDEIGKIVKLSGRQARKGLKGVEADKLLRSVVKKDKEDKNRDKDHNGGDTNGERTKKWQQTTYYYIDYKQFVDIVKYRIYEMRNKMSQGLDKELECQSYTCPNCRRKYPHFCEALDVAKLAKEGSLYCEARNCGSELEEDDNSQKVSAAQQRQAEMLTQLRSIIDQLKKTEGIKIPAVDITMLTRPDEENVGSGMSDQQLEVIISENATMTHVNNSMFANLPVVQKSETKPSKPTTETSQPQKPAQPQQPTHPHPKTEPEAKPLPPWLTKPVALEIKTEDVVMTVVEAPVQEKPVVEDAAKQQLINDYMTQMKSQQAMPVAVPSGSTEEEAQEEDDEEEETVKVGARVLKLSEVTEEDKAKMSKEEYEDYWQKYQQRLAAYYDT